MHKQRITPPGLRGLGRILCLRGKYPEAHALYQEALALSEDAGQQLNLDWVLAELGTAKMHLGQYEEARARAKTSLTLAREASNRSEIGHSLRLLGSVALTKEAYSEAQQSLGESVAIYREIGQRADLGWVLAVLGYAEWGLGDLRQAGTHLSDALHTAADTGAFAPLMHALPVVALLLADQGV